MTIRYRLEQGKLTTLYGPPRPWPDSLQLTSDVSLKVKVFTVGFHDMVTRFRDLEYGARTRVDHRRATRTEVGSAASSPSGSFARRCTGRSRAPGR